MNLGIIPGATREFRKNVAAALADKVQWKDVLSASNGSDVKRHPPDPNHAGRALCGRRLPAWAPWGQRRSLPVCRKCAQQRRRAASGQIRQQISKGRPGRQWSLFELLPNEPEFFS